MKGERAVIGVFGHYGNNNLGDEAIIESSIQNIRERDPDAEVCCFSLRPADTAVRHNVEAFCIEYAEDGPGPIRPEAVPGDIEFPWQLHEAQIASGIDPDEVEDETNQTGLKATIKKIPFLVVTVRTIFSIPSRLMRILHEIRHIGQSRAYLKKFDLLVVAGSNQFLDNFGGPWGFPYTTFKWTMLCRMTKTRIAFVSIGANPLEHALSGKMIRSALRKADYLSYRDEASKSLIETTDVGFSGNIYPDLAFGLRWSKAESLVASKRPLIGLNPMPVYDHRYWCVSDDGRYGEYVKNLAAFADRVIENGNQLLFFGTMWRDDSVIVDIIKEMKSDEHGARNSNYVVRKCNEVSELVDLFQEIDIAVSTRFHGTVLPLLVGTPVIGVGYYRKNSDLVDKFGLGEYYEILEELDAGRLSEKLQSLIEQIDGKRETIGPKASDYKRLVGEQWDQVLALVN